MVAREQDRLRHHVGHFLGVFKHFPEAESLLYLRSDEST